MYCVILFLVGPSNTQENDMLPRFNKKGRSPAEIYPLSSSILECGSKHVGADLLDTVVSTIARPDVYDSVTRDFRMYCNIC